MSNKKSLKSMLEYLHVLLWLVGLAAVGTAWDPRELGDMEEGNRGEMRDVRAARTFRCYWSDLYYQRADTRLRRIASRFGSSYNIQSVHVQWHK